MGAEKQKEKGERCRVQKREMCVVGELEDESG